MGCVVCVAFPFYFLLFLLIKSLFRKQIVKYTNNYIHISRDTNIYICIYTQIHLAQIEFSHYYFNTQLNDIYIITFIYCYSYISTGVYFYLLFEILTINNIYIFYIHLDSLDSSATRMIYDHG